MITSMALVVIRRGALWLPTAPATITQFGMKIDS